MENGVDKPLTQEFEKTGANLSGGEAQKIALARVFARPFELIVMDEPLSSLDPNNHGQMNDP